VSNLSRERAGGADTECVGAAGVGPSVRLAGRSGEQQLLAAALAGAASGQPCAVVVHGEAGVGKTRLVRDACDGLAPEVEVLWGACVHFGEASVPFAPVTAALRGWLARAVEATRAAVLAGAGELGTLLPALGDAGTGEPGRLLPLIDLVFNRLTARAPTVLVVDDLQWADRTSLDVLAYLITGFGAQQRLAVLATCREEHRGEGHPLHGWLADLRRMPGFSEIQLDRLDLAATEAQIEGLLGRVVDVGLVTQVQERSGGNPYLTELLVRSLSGAETALPTTAPAALREALLASWHALSARARQATRILAVGGRPTEPSLLADVASDHGVTVEQLSRGMTEAHDYGVIWPARSGRAWFRHPLLAEILYDDMPPGEAARLHATYAQLLESQPGAAAAGTAAEIAVHTHRAGSLDDAYRWSLVAADQAAGLHAAAEEAIHLERACSLLDQVSPDALRSGAGHIDLLFRTSRACERAGRIEAATARLEQALSLIDRDREPLLASTLLVALSALKWQRSAQGRAVAEEVIEAIEITTRWPDSPERAWALASLAGAQMWDGILPDTAINADEAVRIARRSGSPVALANALNVRASVHLHLDEIASSLEDANEADLIARSCGDYTQQEAAANWRVMCLQELGHASEATAIALDAFHTAVKSGSLHWGYFLAALAAEGLLHSGHWQECRALLRDALSAQRDTVPGAAVRLVAAQLAVRSGAVAAARQHLERALELIPGDFPGLRMRTALAGAEVFMASGEPLSALEWVQARIVDPQARSDAAGRQRPNLRPVQYNDQLLVPFARAAAELAATGRDAGDTDTVVRAISSLDEILRRWPHEPFSTVPDVDIRAMRKALFAAEVARCRRHPDEATRWAEAIEKCHVAGAIWDEAVSRWRCARALLTAGSPGPAVAEHLRVAHRCAVELGAQPLQNEVEALARMARITLRQPVPIAGTPPPPAPLAGLTARERQILTFLQAGRSNGEIAKELVISDKTVSVHVSNILRKTGTSSEWKRQLSPSDWSSNATTDNRPTEDHARTSQPAAAGADTATDRQEQRPHQLARMHRPARLRSGGRPPER
jgi:DNA-binding CsgD family transcriptional regulator/tetratricopeptide (TPR) repeat protein